MGYKTAPTKEVGPGFAVAQYRYTNDRFISGTVSEVYGVVSIALNTSCRQTELVEGLAQDIQNGCCNCVMQ